jgi:hypothetical protein
MFSLDSFVADRNSSVGGSEQIDLQPRAEACQGAFTGHDGEDPWSLRDDRALALSGGVEIGV